MNDKADQIVERLSEEDAKPEIREEKSPTKGNSFGKAPFHRELILFFLISTLTWGMVTVMMLATLGEYTRRVQASLQAQSERFEKMLGDMDRRFTALPDKTGQLPVSAIPTELKEGER
jgi:hypothetical protein